MSTTILSKRNVDSDTWLLLGGTLIVFGIVLSIGIWILCYRHRGYRRNLVRQRAAAAASKKWGKYARLDEERATGPVQTVEGVDQPGPLDLDAAPSPRPDSTPGLEQDELLMYPRLQNPVVRAAESAPSIELQTAWKTLHPVDSGLYLPPPAMSQGPSRPSSSPGSIDGLDSDYDYDGRTGRTYDRSQSPSMHSLVLCRSASMLKR